MLETIDTAIRERKAKRPRAGEEEAAAPETTKAGKGSQVQPVLAAGSRKGKGHSHAEPAIQ